MIYYCIFINIVIIQHAIIINILYYKNESLYFIVI